MPSNHLIFCHPLLLLPSIFPSIRVFSDESALHISWPKYWSFSFNISPTNEHSGLISFRMNWLDLLAVQGTLKSLLQHHSSQALTIGPLNNWDVTKLRVTPPPATPSTQLLHTACSKGKRAPWGSLVCNLLFPVCLSLNPSCFIRAGFSQTSS